MIEPIFFNCHSSFSRKNEILLSVLSQARTIKLMFMSLSSPSPSLHSKMWNRLLWLKMMSSKYPTRDINQKCSGEMTVNSMTTEGRVLNLLIHDLLTKMHSWTPFWAWAKTTKASHSTSKIAQARLLCRVFAFRGILFVQMPNSLQLWNGSKQAVFTF